MLRLAFCIFLFQMFDWWVLLHEIIERSERNKAIGNPFSDAMIDPVTNDRDGSPGQLFDLVCRTRFLAFLLAFDFNFSWSFGHTTDFVFLHPLNRF